MTRKDAIRATMLAEAARQSAHYKRSIFLTYHENDIIHFTFTKGPSHAASGDDVDASSLNSSITTAKPGLIAKQGLMAKSKL